MEVSPKYGFTTSSGILAASRRKDLDLGKHELQVVSEPVDESASIMHNRYYQTERACGI